MSTAPEHVVPSQALREDLDRSRATGHRRALVLLGDPRDTDHAARDLLAALDIEDVSWIDETEEHPVRALLGREADTVVVSLHVGFDPDLLGAAHGVVRAGGLLVLRAPPLDEWDAHRGPFDERLAVAPHGLEEVGGRFARRLRALVRNAPGVWVLDAATGNSSTQPVTKAAAEAAAAPTRRPTGRFRSADQARAVEALEGVTPGAPVVLTSARGRGKSAALGLAVARLARGAHGRRRVWLTAPTRHAAEVALSFARADDREDGVRFAPPARVARRASAGDVVLVDEAAAIPLPVLDALLDTGAALACATTVHGYEGTGRGFLLRFVDHLRSRFPGLRELRLETPIRWAPGDPLERFVRNGLLLDAEPAPGTALTNGADPDVVAAGSTATAWETRVLDRDALAADEARLSELFGLLIWAHYRTTPGDLRRLLDAPNLEVAATFYEGHVVAAALIAHEGDLDPGMAVDVGAGRMRPRGHALPENLACHLGRTGGATLPALRVVRIATHPALRRRGLGTALLDAVEARGREVGARYLGSVFGATPELLRFWHRAGYETVRLAVSRGARSGEHAALVLRSVDPGFDREVSELRAKLGRDLPHLLLDPLRHLDPDLAAMVLEGTGRRPRLEADDIADLAAWAFGPRPYDVTVRPVFELVAAALGAERPAIDPAHRRLAVTKVLQGRPWEEAAAEAGFGSVPQAMRALRRALRPLVLTLGDEAKREASRFPGA